MIMSGTVFISSRMVSTPGALFGHWIIAQPEGWVVLFLHLYHSEEAEPVCCWPATLQIFLLYDFDALAVRQFLLFFCFCFYEQ